MQTSGSEILQIFPDNFRSKFFGSKKGNAEVTRRNGPQRDYRGKGSRRKGSGVSKASLLRKPPNSPQNLPFQPPAVTPALRVLVKAASPLTPLLVPQVRSHRPRGHFHPQKGRGGRKKEDSGGCFLQRRWRNFFLWTKKATIPPSGKQSGDPRRMKKKVGWVIPQDMLLLPLLAL
ncbi:uncharacterized protein LOC124166973 [Ischnura elegans]|uniref:uncharacterized protein LOC124166973 n=1 Tax=Ischnura elegans TaxID=197161 RepID=UPI001ED8BF23|nr:uncharacterized protein LOC124166973 [Ischnura elegans]